MFCLFWDPPLHCCESGKLLQIIENKNSIVKALVNEITEIHIIPIFLLSFLNFS